METRPGRAVQCPRARCLPARTSPPRGRGRAGKAKGAAGAGRRGDCASTRVSWPRGRLGRGRKVTGRRLAGGGHGRSASLSASDSSVGEGCVCFLLPRRGARGRRAQSRSQRAEPGRARGSLTVPALPRGLTASASVVATTQAGACGRPAGRETESAAKRKRRSAHGHQASEQSVPAPGTKRSSRLCGSRSPGASGSQGRWEL